MTSWNGLHRQAGDFLLAPRWGRVLRSLVPTPGNVLFTTLLVTGLLAAHVVSASPAPAPATLGTSIGSIPYQGRLTDVNGTPLNGTYPMSFSLYLASSGGPALWNEPWSAVTVTTGLFNVLLGSIVAIPPNVIATNNTLWLGISVGTDGEMSPRIQLGSAPFAMQAQTVPNGSITTAQLADASVTTSKIASQGVTTAQLADASVTQSQSVAGLPSRNGQSTSSTTFVDEPGASVNLNTTGGTVLVLFTGSHVPTGGAPFVAYWQIVRDESSSSVILAYNNQTFPTTDWRTISTFGIDTPPAGSHTYTVQWRVSTGTIQQSQNTYTNNIAAVEFKR